MERPDSLTALANVHYLMVFNLRTCIQHDFTPNQVKLWKGRTPKNHALSMVQNLVALLSLVYRTNEKCRYDLSDHGASTNLTSIPFYFFQRECIAWGIIIIMIIPKHPFVISRHTVALHILTVSNFTNASYASDLLSLWSFWHFSQLSLVF